MDKPLRIHQTPAPAFRHHTQSYLPVTCSSYFLYLRESATLHAISRPEICVISDTSDIPKPPSLSQCCFTSYIPPNLLPYAGTAFLEAAFISFFHRPSSHSFPQFPSRVLFFKCQPGPIVPLVGQTLSVLLFCLQGENI